MKRRQFLEGNTAANLKKAGIHGAGDRSSIAQVSYVELSGHEALTNPCRRCLGLGCGPYTIRGLGCLPLVHESEKAVTGEGVDIKKKSLTSADVRTDGTVRQDP